MRTDKLYCARANCVRTPVEHKMKLTLRVGNESGDRAKWALNKYRLLHQDAP
jgi:hypothetical protein